MADSATEVEVTFAAVPGGTQVTLVHLGWEKLGAGAKDTYLDYDGGWEYVLSQYVQRAEL
jgi:hypothetical protein